MAESSLNAASNVKPKPRSFIKELMRAIIPSLIGLHIYVKSVMKKFEVGERVRYIGHEERYRGTYKVVYENEASVAVENEDLLILGFDQEVFLRDFTNDLYDY